MKAIVYKRYGGPEVLEYVDLPEPKMPQNSIVVRVKAASLNPADIALQQGLGASIMDSWFPIIPGWDVAGVVEKVGPGVTALRQGDDVIGYLYNEILHSGTFAELVAGSASAFVRKPACMSWQEAGALPLCGLTAYQALTETLHVVPRETIYIHGASGGVGSLAVQIAISKGVRVIGSASSTNHSYLRALGAEPVTHENFEEDVLALVPAGVDAVLQCSGKMSAENIAHAGTRLASIVSSGDEFALVYARPSRENLLALAKLVEEGAIRVRVGATCSLHQAADAEATLMSGAANGKIVLVPNRNT